VAGADAICQQEADIAGFPGTYLAWISDSSSISPAVRFTQSPDPYVLPNGTVVAYGWSDLTNGDIQHPIDQTPLGPVLLPASVWSNTNTGGSVSSIYTSCLDWTNGSDEAGGIGDAGSAVAGWTDTAAFQCSVPGHLYCFQQSGQGGNPPPGPRPCGYGGDCIAFVTDGTHDGALGGIAGADAICQAEADTNNLPGTYRAWISDDSGVSPASRFVHATGKYVLVSGTVIADNWTDLTDGLLYSAIERTASGDFAPSSAAWSNTTDDGEMIDPPQTCNNWTSGASFDAGNVGDVLASTAWSQALIGSFSCDWQWRLFCFQQSGPTPE
jgi:hypothetical protein